MAVNGQLAATCLSFHQITHNVMVLRINVISNALNMNSLLRGPSYNFAILSAKPRLGRERLFGSHSTSHDQLNVR